MEPAGTLDAVRFGLLGPLHVVDGAGAARAVPAAKQRIVLAALLLSHGHMVSAAGLAEALWDASAPPNAPSVLRTYVMRLRRALGPAGGRIAGRPPGWALELHGPEEFDLAEVDGLWRASRAAAGAGEWRQVSSLLTRALSLRRGEPLVDVPYIADRAYFLGSLGDACYGLGRYQDALKAFGRALPTFREHGLRRHEALCLLKLAESHLALGHTSQATPYLARCQPAFTDLRLPAYTQRVQKAMERCTPDSRSAR